jgi:hypothetical protein
MHAHEYERFTKLHTDDKLILPDLPGTVIANLAVKADKAISGRFLSWDEDDCKPYRR